MPVPHRDAVRLTDPITDHGEGPFWDAADGRLLLVDMLAGAIVSWEPSGSTRRFDVPGPVAAVIRARRSGGYVVALEHEVAVSSDLVTFHTIATVIDEPAVRLNEGGCDPGGWFFCGSMAYDERAGAGALYRIDPDGSVATVLPAVTISNGLQWSSDGRRAFYVDTPTRRIDVLDVDPDTGGLANRRPHVAIDPALGHPDGLAIDAEDGLWLAHWGGSAVHHYDAAGRLVGVIDLPVSQVTACAFGGPRGSTLYITTSAHGLNGAEPLAGSLFAFEADAVGAVPHPFAG